LKQPDDISAEVEASFQLNKILESLANPKISFGFAVVFPFEE
jgi:hypothetical protein